MIHITPDEHRILVDAIQDSATVVHKGRKNMNERIGKLAEQAREFATTRHPVSNIVLSVNSEKFEEKFAELIVRECVSIGDNYQDILGNEPECFNCRKVAYGIVDKIKEHFGVEE